MASARRAAGISAWEVVMSGDHDDAEKSASKIRIQF